MNLSVHDRTGVFGIRKSPRDDGCVRIPSGISRIWGAEADLTIQRTAAVPCAFHGSSVSQRLIVDQCMVLHERPVVKLPEPPPILLEPFDKALAEKEAQDSAGQCANEHGISGK